MKVRAPSYATYHDSHACHPPVLIITESVYIFKEFYITSFDKYLQLLRLRVMSLKQNKFL